MKKKIYTKIVSTKKLYESIKKSWFNLKRFYLATKSFKLAYPPEMLTESSYLILPFAERKFNSFAINIDGVDAVLIAK